MARIPEVTDWKILKNGSVTGTVRFHPEIDDGDVITTSPLADPDVQTENVVVATVSGSKYKLAIASAVTKKTMEKKKAKEAKAAAAAEAKAAAAEAKAAAAAAAASNKSKRINNSKKTASKKVDKLSMKVEKLAKKAASEKVVEKKAAKPEIKLSGKSIGGGKYLLAGAQRSTSGKSQIWEAYLADKNGEPVTKGTRLKAKLSSNTEALTREDKNYQRATGGLFNGRFVQKLEFYENAGAGFEGLSALVIEAGVMDLKALLIQRQARGLEGKAMRDAAVAAGQCIQAMHSSDLVWTDLKPENFVLTVDEDGDDGLSGVKGIDLESAIPFGNNPVDYSPEACPPEFAQAFIKGDAPEFILDPSYDMWSLGMMLYELSTGRAYFEGRSPVTITKTLSSSIFEADVSKVEDNKLLRDLIRECLNVNPKKRPSITQFLLHPYFITSGIGPISF